jgi:hypothetical protein
MTQDEIIEMAKEADFNVSGELILDDMGYVTITNRLEAFAKLVAAKAIAELESQEPMATIAVRWHEPVGKVAYVLEVNLPVGVHKLYTHLPQRTWIGLTDDEFNELYERYVPLTCYALLIEKVEAKLKQKNGYFEDKNT